MKLSVSSLRNGVYSGLRLAMPVLGGLLLMMSAGSAAEQEAEPSAAPSAEDVVSGQEIFLREWLANDSRSHGGDGLGPVFNDTSCVACHNQGGAGGGGAASKNVEIVTVVSRDLGMGNVRRNRSASAEFVRSMFGLGSDRQTPDAATTLELMKLERQRLAEIHPGFGSASSVVLHRFGTDPLYASWRQGLAGGQIASFPNRQMQAQRLVMESVATPQDADSDVQRMQIAMQEIQRVRSELGDVNFSKTSFRDGAQLTLTERNATALFGTGLIDSIPDAAIEALAERKHDGFGDISGRVSRLKDGSIGRFGWKAQKKSLHDFTMTACAVELGLNVPDHPQAGTPMSPEYMTVGYDLNQLECNALVDYLSHLPAPQMRQPANDSEAEYLQAGQKLFATAGCAACHAPEVGEVVGLYSDLLVHDMGADLVDTGDYGSFTPVPDSAEEVVEELAEAKDGEEAQTELRVVGATRQEWRTAPLWGCRDSAPYLHDGRAKTLEQAIAFHGGEAVVSTQNYFTLTAIERQQLLAFLKTLEAPSADRLAQR